MQKAPADVHQPGYIPYGWGGIILSDYESVSVLL